MEIKKCVCLTRWGNLSLELRQKWIEEVTKNKEELSSYLGSEIYHRRYDCVVSKLVDDLENLCSEMHGDYSKVVDTDAIDKIVTAILKDQNWSVVIDDFFKSDLNLAFDPKTGECIDIIDDIDEDVIVIVDGEVCTEN